MSSAELPGPGGDGANPVGWLRRHITPKECARIQSFDVDGLHGAPYVLGENDHNVQPGQRRELDAFMQSRAIDAFVQEPEKFPKRPSRPASSSRNFRHIGRTLGSKRTTSEHRI